MSVTRILHPHRVAIVIAAGIALLVFAAAAYGDIGPSTSGRAMVRKQEMDVALKKTALGTILVDSRGHTLYMFLKDTNRRSVCTAGCAEVWRPLLCNGKPRGGPGVRPSPLSTTTRQDGGLQVTFRGHPLYTSVDDTAPGQTAGEGASNFGAAWYLVAANGRPIKGVGNPDGGYG